MTLEVRHPELNIFVVSRAGLGVELGFVGRLELVHAGMHGFKIEHRAIRKTRGTIFRIPRGGVFLIDKFLKDPLE